VERESKPLSDLRAAIDRIDGEILALVSRRASLAAEIGRAKTGSGLPVGDPAREKEILDRVKAENPGPLDDRAVSAVFASVIRECRSLQAPASAAFLGPVASFSHQAAVTVCGHGVALHPLDSIPEVFDEVESGRCSLGIVPVENSTEGIVTHTLDCFPESNLSIVGEVVLAIRLALLSRSPLTEVRTVYSHPQALAQCRRYLASRLPGAEVGEVSSTAAAAKLAAGEVGAAAVGSEVAGELYGLSVVGEGIEDFHHNRTRFLVIGRGAPPPTGSDRTSLLISLKHRPGVLSAALAPLAEAGINLTKIESRPSKEKAWEYLFFIDVDGHRDDMALKAAMKAMEADCHQLRVLGSYPKDTNEEER
jgi:chorismate mutase/prephenate dehydratase